MNARGVDQRLRALPAQSPRLSLLTRSRQIDVLRKLVDARRYFAVSVTARQTCLFAVWLPVRPPSNMVTKSAIRRDINFDGYGQDSGEVVEEISMHIQRQDEREQGTS